MHATYADDRGATPAGGWFRASFPPVAPAAGSDAPPQATPYERGGYGEQGRFNLKCIATVIVVHAILLVGLVRADVIPIRQKAPPPLVVDLVVEPPAPPPPPAAPEPDVKQVQPVPPVIVSPPPLVATPAPPPPVAVVAAAPPPPQAVVVAPVVKAAAVSAPVAVDLSSKMVSGDPPRYPTESRRKREEGTVVLRLTLALDGSVAEIGVAQGSGFERLDKAALAAVRRWRWSPTMVGGEPVQVRGMVRIPFQLQG